MFTNQFGKTRVSWGVHASLHCILTALLITASNAWAAPDASTLQRDTERQMPRLPAPSAEFPIKAPETVPEPADTGDAVEVKGFVFEGAALIEEKDLQATIADMVGKKLTLPQIEYAARRIADLYRSRGWLVDAVVPPQELTDGIVRISIVVGKLSGIRVEGNAPNSSLQLAGRVLSARAKINEPISSAEIERGILLANDLPGVDVTGVLAPGDAAGQVRLDAKVDAQPIVTGDVYADNYGSRSVDHAHQYSAGLNIAPGAGQQIYLRVLANRDLRSFTARYSLPVGYDGLRLALQASDLRYDLGGSLSDLNVEGSARTYSATVTYPWLRSAQANINLTGGVAWRHYADDILGDATKRKYVRAGNLGINGDRIDTLGGGGRTQASLLATTGNLDLDVDLDLAADRAGANTNGRYSKLEVSLSRLQLLWTDHWTFVTSFTGQWARDNLDSSEKFSLGGPTGVRAYPVSEASGDSGWLLNLELRRSFGNGWRGSAFIDAGGIHQHHETWIGWNNGSNVPNSYRLAGAGLGLNWTGESKFSFDAIIATPIGSNDGRLADGSNQDGSEHSARGWLRLTKFF